MKYIKEKLKNLDRGTFFRVLALILAIVNQIVAVAGANSFASSTVYQIISVSATVIVSLTAAWENNDFTGFARLSTKVLDALEDGRPGRVAARDETLADEERHRVLHAEDARAERLRHRACGGQLVAGLQVTRQDARAVVFGDRAPDGLGSFVHGPENTPARPACQRRNNKNNNRHHAKSRLARGGVRTPPRRRRGLCYAC